MTKAKRITRKRSVAQGVERATGERVSARKTGTSVLRRGALSKIEGAACGAQRQRRAVWKPARAHLATAFYKIYGELAGLSETRPALGRNILARALTAMGTSCDGRPEGHSPSSAEWC